MEKDIIAKIDKITSLFCGWCHRPLLETSYSLDFCCEDHQEEWRQEYNRKHLPKFDEVEWVAGSIPDHIAHPERDRYWQAGLRQTDGFRLGRVWNDGHPNMELHVDLRACAVQLAEMGRQLTRLGEATLASMSPGIAEIQRALQAMQPLTFQRPPEVTEDDVKTNALRWAQRNRNVGPGLPPVWMTKVWR